MRNPLIFHMTASNMQTKTISSKVYTIEINTQEGTGTFTHKRLGTTGTLMFENENQLVDFDGVEYLPLDVLQLLARSGFDVESFM